jgi:hypothetical protein
MGGALYVVFRAVWLLLGSEKYWEEQRTRNWQ